MNGERRKEFRSGLALVAELGRCWTLPVDSLQSVLNTEKFPLTERRVSCKPTGMSDSGYGSNSVASDLAGGDAGNLFGMINRDNVHGLNLAVPEDAKEIIKPWNERDDTSKFADSGVDDQMIIHVPFTQSVRLKSIIVKLGRGEVTPRHLRLYANYPNIIDFADAEVTKPQLDISLLEGETGVVEYPLRVAAFASVSSLSLYFSDSVGGDSCRIYYLGFKGETRSERRDASSKLEIPAANAADAPIVDRLSEKAAGQQTTAR